VATLKLFVVRHAETAWTAERRFSGQRDVPLAAGGEVQAEALAQALAGAKLAAIYSSPLERARTTAEIIAKPHRLPVQVDAALREMGFGRWEGRTRDDVAASEPAAWAVWRERPHALTAHDGDTLPAVAARLDAFVAGVRQRHGDDSIVLVTHAIVVRLIVLAALGLGPDRLWSVDASPAGLSEVDFGPEWTTVHRMNTLAHLEPRA
jgi:broad specificity phosphatase PhoE